MRPAPLAVAVGALAIRPDRWAANWRGRRRLARRPIRPLLLERLLGGAVALGGRHRRVGAAGVRAFNLDICRS